MNDIYESEIFKITRPEAKSRMESTIIEGLALPSREQWQRNAAPAKVTAAAREDTRTWLEQLIRPEYRKRVCAQRRLVDHRRAGRTDWELDGGRTGDPGDCHARSGACAHAIADRES